ncbi:MAG: signal transduction histidine kinase/flagellar basal body-associated protein FliL [Pseudohongiellaceae bacterium]|jgi:signal transduction histidine kinase/flagellar basal body-associated protein FliL
MNETIQKKGISRQVILIVLLVIVLITGGMLVMVSVSSFNNLASITLNELERMSKIFASQLQAQQRNAAKYIMDIESHTLLLEQLEQIANLGPYYYSDESLLGVNLEEPDKIYGLEAQINIIQALKPLQTAHQVTSISLYSLSPFNLIPDARPVLNVRMDTEGIWLGAFDKKGSIENRKYYYNRYENFRPPESDLFNVSSVYQLTVKEFYQKIQFRKTDPIGFEDVLSADAAQTLASNVVSSEFMIQNGVPTIRTQAVLKVSVSNPDSWEAEQTEAILIVLEQEIDKDQLLAFKQQLGIDVGLAKQNEILLSSVSIDEAVKVLNPDKTVTGASQSFYYASQTVVFSQVLQAGIQAVVLSPISILAKLTQSMFTYMALLAIVATIIASILIYWVVRRLINLPLSQLMTGVEKISAGKLDHQVNVLSKNEFGQLAYAFNNMSSELGKKTNQLQRYAASLEASNIELKRYQSTLEEMVEQRTSTLKSAQNQLIESEKMASLGALVAGVAHEINTPVGVGVTAASFLKDETDTINKKYSSNLMTKENFEEYLSCCLQTTDIIFSNLQRATELVKSFKQVAVDKTVEEHRLFSVISYIEEVLLTLHPRLKKTHHSIEVTGERGIEIDSYPGSFSQIVTNLIMNSVIHAFEEGVAGCITLHIEREDEQVILTYTDNGIGIDQENLAKIFDPFFTTKRGLGGTGLGMHIVYNLVTQQFKGRIKCESHLQEGVKFTITIPVTISFTISTS